MTGTLASYFRRRVGIQVLALLAVFVALMQLLELLDVTTEILSRNQGLGDVLYYAMLRAPAELVLALPLAVLLGTMTALHSMARGLEIASMRTIGISLARIFVYLLPMLVAMAAVQFALSESVLPRAETRLKQWWNANAMHEEAPAPLWAHTSDGPVSIGGFAREGRELERVSIYRRDRSGLIEARFSALRADWNGRTWHLTDVTELHIEGGGIRWVHDDEREWQTNLRPEEVLRLDLARPHLSSTMLIDVIAGTRVGTQPLSYYRTVLYRSFTAPFGLLVMLLLALPTACSLPSRTGSRELLVALVLGLAFLLCDGIVAALGTSGRLPPLATALAAPLLFALIGIARVRACERI